MTTAPFLAHAAAAMKPMPDVVPVMAMRLPAKVGKSSSNLENQTLVGGFEREQHPIMTRNGMPTSCTKTLAGESNSKREVAGSPELEPNAI